MNPLYIEITPEPVEPGTSGIGKDGKPYTIPSKQPAYCHQGAAFPMPFKVPVDDKEGPYRPGFYLIGPGAFRPGQYVPIVDDRALKLVPLADALQVLGTMQAERAKAAARSEAKA